MRSLATIKCILSEPVASSGLLARDLVIQSLPATMAQLSAVERDLPRKLSEFHRRFLLAWNGLDLDVVRFFAAPPAYGCIATLTEGQALLPRARSNWIAVASDPAGFLYAEDEQGAIWSIDHDGGSERRVASSLDDFISSYIFGDRSVEFGGEPWRLDLETHGILPAT
jgi:hypothetical protein